MTRVTRYPVKIKPITLEINPRVETQFRDAARGAFPNEVFAYLMGHDLGNRITVETIVLPPVSGVKSQTEVSVETCDWVNWEAVQWAKENDLVIVGDIHTHPWDESKYGDLPLDVDVCPSSADWDDRTCRGRRWITAICVARRWKSGAMRYRFRYWGPLTPLNVVKRSV